MQCASEFCRQMTVLTSDIYTNLLRRLWENRFSRPIKRAFVRRLLSSGITRSLLNRYYDQLSFQSMERFFLRYGGTFSDHVKDGTWHIYFAGRNLLVPLDDSLYWSIALQILGHDAAIKETYQALITSDQRPVLFIDVGANYGTHTVLFLLHEIPVLAFEPNAECFGKFKSICDLNSLQGDWEMVALGNYVGEIELLYPERRTWMGKHPAEAAG